MSKIDDGGHAFAHGNPEQGGDPGMSLRDWLAGQAMASYGAPFCEAETQQIVAKRCYQMADAMIAERSKTRAES